jgi:ABC-type phosphate transport system substrate-binding protein
MKHLHHIIPKHMGGTDEPENLIELTVEEHAEAHKKLWEQYERWEDKLAWQGLAGLIGKEELIKQMLIEAAKKGNASRPTNKGKKYNWKKSPKPVGTGGTRWFHNPENPTEKKCFRADQSPPDGWVRGQGRKAVNPGSNFHKKSL